VGNLSGARFITSANNSSVHGYVCCGQVDAYDRSSVDRFQFPFDSGAVTTESNLVYAGKERDAIDGVDFVTMFT